MQQFAINSNKKTDCEQWGVTYVNLHWKVSLWINGFQSYRNRFALLTGVSFGLNAPVGGKQTHDSCLLLLYLHFDRLHVINNSLSTMTIWRETMIWSDLDRAFKLLEKPNYFVQLVLADFSLAFNNMQPHSLIDQLAPISNEPTSSYCWL